MINSGCQILHQNSSRRGLLFLFFFLFFLVSIYINLSAFVGIYDEGISTYDAVRILHGDIPYRDFSAEYGPGQFYVLAFLFKIFGTSLVVERIWSQVVFVFLLLFSYLILNKFCSRRATKIGVFIIALVLLNFSTIVLASCNPMFPAFLCCIASSYFLLNYFLDGLRRWALLSGTCVAATALFRPELGLAILFLELLIAAIFFYLRPIKANNSPFKISEHVNALLWYLSSILIIITPVLVFFVSHCSFKDLVFDFFIFPVYLFPKLYSYPYFLYLAFPAHAMKGIGFFYVFSKEFICFFPAAVLITGMLSLIGQVVRSKNKGKISVLWYGGVLFTALGLVFLKYSSTRTDFPHFFPLLFTSVILLFLIFYNFPQIKNLKSWLSVLILLFCFAITFNLINELEFINRSKIGFFDIKLARGIAMDPASYYLQESVRYIQQNVQPEEKIFVGSFSHDRVMISDILFYFLSERSSATKYAEFESGITTTKEIQQRIIEDIEKNAVRFVILDSNDWWCEPNESCKSSGVHLLDNFIRNNFTVVRVFGNYIIMHRIIQQGAV